MVGDARPEAGEGVGVLGEDVGCGWGVVVWWRGHRCGPGGEEDGVGGGMGVLGRTSVVPADVCC